VGGGNERENVVVAELILSYLGKPKSLIRLVTDRPGHDRRYAVDCSRLRHLGWRPIIPFEEGLRATVRWYREQESWWRPIKSGEFRQYYEEQYRRRLDEGATCGS
jgi:dTDP-glucose 4,6-dehydratase